MEQVKLLKSECLEVLRGAIADNLERYRSGDFSGLLDCFEADVEVDYGALGQIHEPSGENLKDVENSVLIREVFAQLSPYAARDERLWVYLTHGPLLSYSRKRWPIPDNDEKAVKSIRSHFFAGDKRNLEARNAVSRLYWLAHVAARVKDLDIAEALSLILHTQDVRQNVIERPTVLQVDSILVAVVKKLKASRSGDGDLFQRDVFRGLQERLNEACGYMFLEALPAEAVERLLDRLIEQSVSEAALANG